MRDKYTGTKRKEREKNFTVEFERACALDKIQNFSFSLTSYKFYAEPTRINFYFFKYDMLNII
jgi:hypothetical protein